MLRKAPTVKQNGIIFLTGANGYIGSAVAQHLIARGFKVLGLIRSVDGISEAVANGVFPVVGKLQDQEVMTAAINESDAIIHTAAAGPLPDGDIAAMIERSVEAINFFRDISRQKGIRLITTSGASMYGGIPANEETKLPTESFFAQLAQLENTLEQQEHVAVLRSSLVYGRGSSKPILASLGPMYDLGHVVKAGSGHHVSVVHVDDLAALYVKAITSEKLMPVLLGASEQIETEKILLAAAQNLGLPPEIKEISPEEAMQQFSVLGQYTMASMNLDASLTRKHLDWGPSRLGIVEDLQAGSYKHQLIDKLKPYSEKAKQS